MSEAITPAAGLYPADGGASTAVAPPPVGTTTEQVQGSDTATTSAGLYNDTASGADTTSATDTVTSTEGADSVTAAAGSDTVSMPEYDFKLPEGFTQNDALNSEAKTVFAEAGVAPDKVQPLIDLFGKAMKAASDEQVAAHTTQQTTWLQEINALPEFTGSTREKSLASIGRLFDEFGTPEAKQALNAYGVGNNPALVKMMLKIAATVSEGAPASQGRPTGESGRSRSQPRTVGQSLYGEVSKN